MRELLILILFAIAGLIAEVLGTLAGFGSSVIFVPIANFFLDYQLVLGITAFFHIFSNISKLVLFGKYLDLKLIFQLGFPSVILVALGAWLSAEWNSHKLQLILGIFLCVFALVFYFYPKIRVKKSVANLTVFGGISGFLAGLLGTGGAVRGLALTSLELGKEVFIGTSAAIDFGVDITRAVIYSDHAFIRLQDWKYLVILIFVAIIGSWLGKILLGKLSQRSFEKAVLLLVFISGLLLMIKFFNYRV